MGQSNTSNRHPFLAGQAPVGTNIYGEHGFVDTHFPRTASKYPGAQPGQWVAEDGGVPIVWLSDSYYMMNDETVGILRSRADRGEFAPVGIKSAADLDEYLQRAGLYNTEGWRRE